MQPLTEFLQKEQDTAVLATFCGDMAEDFFSGSSEMSSQYKVYGTGFTSDETWLGKIAYPGYDWNAAIAWARNLDITENKAFVNIMNGIKHGKANLFSLLGWEAAQLIGLENTEFSGMIIHSPRGKVYMNPENGFSEADVYYAIISKDEETGNCLLKDLRVASVTEAERKGLEGNIEYIPFPEHLKGAYQSYTQADISGLKTAGYAKDFLTVKQGVTKYLDWLNLGVN